MSPLEGDYEPSPYGWVRDQVAEYEASGGRRANTLWDTGLPIVVVTTRGNKTGKLRKTPLMRVEHSGEYALVASQGGQPRHPVWYHNLKADPEAVTIQDGPQPFDVRVREVTGNERAAWWKRAVAAYPPYADYQERAERQIPVFITTKQQRRRLPPLTAAGPILKSASAQVCGCPRDASSPSGKRKPVTPPTRRAPHPAPTRTARRQPA
jgi:deazaflavin-dependent oxidoreductase (nitroreductase family)